MPHNNQQLIDAAETAFGPKWRRPLAKAMGEHQTQMQRWALGLSEVPDDRLEKGLEACQQQKDAILRRLLGKG